MTDTARLDSRPSTDKRGLLAKRCSPVHRETSSVGKAIERQIGSIGRRLAHEDPKDLAVLIAIENKLAEAWATAIAGQRASGSSDGEIGAVLGVTKQAVQQRWPRRDDGER